MNIPKERLIEFLQKVCEAYREADNDDDELRKNIKSYAYLDVAEVLFSVQHEIILLNVDNIIAEVPQTGWGHALFGALKSHQKELGVDYD